MSKKLRCTHCNKKLTYYLFSKDKPYCSIICFVKQKEQEKGIRTTRICLQCKKTESKELYFQFRQFCSKSCSDKYEEKKKPSTK